MATDDPIAIDQNDAPRRNRENSVIGDGRGFNGLFRVGQAILEPLDRNETQEFGIGDIRKVVAEFPTIRHIKSKAIRPRRVGK